MTRERPFSLWREELKRAWRDLRGEELSPARGAAAVAIGIFIGSQPIFGCHTPLVLLLCLRLRLDAAIAWVAANISNPFFAPFLLTAEVEVGGFLRTGKLLHLDVEVARSSSLRELVVQFGGDLFAGAPVVGLALALAGAAVTYAGISLKRAVWPLPPGHRPARYRLPPAAPPWIQAAERVAERYAPPDAAASAADKTRFHYVRIKLTGDPVARLIADVAGDANGALGRVIDVGTGRGQLPVLLLELGRATSARGVDWDAEKIEQGKVAAARDEALPLELERGDAREADLGEGDTVLLIDLLHYFKKDEQDAILRRAAAAVRPGGRLLVREADTERGWRSFMTLAEERLFTALRFNRGERVLFRPAREIAEVLEAEGLVSRIVPAWGKTPFSNVLVIAERAPPPGA